MTSPTLAQIALGPSTQRLAEDVTYVLARELIALREKVDALSDIDWARFSEGTGHPVEPGTWDYNRIANDRLAWIQEAHRLEAQLATQAEQHAVECERLRVSVNTNASVVYRLQQQLAERSESLLKFGVHLQSCRTDMPYTVLPGHGCTCGLSDALATTVTPEEAS